MSFVVVVDSDSDDGVGEDEIFLLDDDDLDEYLKEVDEFVMLLYVNVLNGMEMISLGNFDEIVSV